MMAEGLIPILTHCSPLIASLFPIPIPREFGKGRDIQEQAGVRHE